MRQNVALVGQVIDDIDSCYPETSADRRLEYHDHGRRAPARGPLLPGNLKKHLPVLG